MTERGTDIALRGGIRQVALPARHRQLLREVAQQRVGDADVALGVLEIDRVHLVRHGGGTDLARLHLLREISQRDIAPHVAVEIEQDAVGACIGIEQLGSPIVRLDLRRIGVEFQAEVLDEAAAETFPVEVRVGHQMGVVVADRAIDLAQHADCGDAITRAGKAMREVGHLFAKRRRRGGLAVGACEHRHGGVAPGERTQCVHQSVKARQHHFLARFRIVDCCGACCRCHCCRVFCFCWRA